MHGRDLQPTRTSHTSLASKRGNNPKTLASGRLKSTARFRGGSRGCLHEYTCSQGALNIRSASALGQFCSTSWKLSGRVIQFPTVPRRQQHLVNELSSPADRYRRAPLLAIGLHIGTPGDQDDDPTTQAAQSKPATAVKGPRLQITRQRLNRRAKNAKSCLQTRLFDRSQCGTGIAGVMVSMQCRLVPRNPEQ